MVLADIKSMINDPYSIKEYRDSVEIYRDRKHICYMFIDEFGIDGRGEAIIVTNEDYFSLCEKRRQNKECDTKLIRTNSDSLRNEILENIKHFEI